MQHPSWTSPSSSFCPSSLLAFIQDCIKIIDTPNCLILHDHPNFKTSITSQCWQNLCGNCSKQKFLFFCGLQKSAPLKIKKTSYINSRWSLFPSKKPYHINLRCFSFLLCMYVWYDPARVRGILLIRRAQRKTGSIKKIPNAQLNLPYGEHSPWLKAQWTQETSQSNVEQISRNNHPPKKEEEEEKKNYVTSFKVSLQGGCRLGPCSLPKSNWNLRENSYWNR